MDTFVEDVRNPIKVQKHKRTDDTVIDNCKIKEPCVGMIFGSLEEAKSFYEEYGRHKGYGTRIRSTYRDRHGPDISSALLVCMCEGFNRKSTVTLDEAKIKRNSSIPRSGCKACIRVTNVRGTNAWKVTTFSDQHNHDLFIQSKGDLLKYSRRKPRACENSVEAKRINDVCRQSTRLAYMAGKSEEIYEVVMAVMEETIKKVSEMEEELFKDQTDERAKHEASGYLKSSGSNSFEMMWSTDHTMSLDPLTSQTRGKKRTGMGKEKVSGTYMLESGRDMVFEGHARDTSDYQCTKRKLSQSKLDALFAS